MNSKLLLLLTIGLTGVALMVGCGGDDDVPATQPMQEKAAESADEAPPPPATEEAPVGQTRTQGGNLSEQLRITIEIPGYYPEDGPIYPGAKPSQAQQSSNGRVSLMFGTDETPAEASSVMSEAAEAKGWTIVSEDQMERGWMTQAEKDSRKMMILTSLMDGGTDDAVTLVAVSMDP